MDPGIFLPIEAVSTGRLGIDTVHERIHGGDSFFTTHTVSVGTGTVASCLITTPAGAERAHFTYGVEATLACTITFSEAPNASGGTALTELNLDRASTHPAVVAVTHTPTYVSAGTILANHALGTPVVGSQDGGRAGGRFEWLLAASTLYLIRVTALNAGTTVDINCSWYEA